MGVCSDEKVKIKRNCNSKIEEDYQERYPCSYNENQLIEKINKFIATNENDIQDAFYKKQTNDPIFELLKKEEREILINYFNSKKNSLIDSIQNKLNALKGNIFGFNEITSNIIDVENGEKAYKNKIKREISKINNNKDSFKIDFLSIMLVGQSGVGKSTLINNFLKLSGRKAAPKGTGKYVTTKIKYYMSNEIPYLRLIDTRGIELNVNYGAEAVKNDASTFIMEQLNTNNINNFVSCIWYCITGNRFQQAEEDLLNALRGSYGDNTIPIIIVYTQAVDEDTISEMSQYIKDRKINATFIKVLAEKKKLINKSYMEPYGLDDLLKETLLKCKKAIQGDMRKVMANNIAQYIKDLLIKENSKIRRYINEQTILNFINNKYTILSDLKFEKYIIDIYGNNIKYFFEKEGDIINGRNLPIFIDSQIIKNNYNNYKSFFEETTEGIIRNDKENLSVKLLDLQAKIERNNDNNIFRKNKRILDDFRETTTNFLQDNFYCISQKYYISFIFQNITNHLSISFRNQLDTLIKNIIQHNDIIEEINKCFLKKFADFETRIGISAPNFNINNNNSYHYNKENYFSYEEKPEDSNELPSKESLKKGSLNNTITPEQNDEDNNSSD